jgi:hypothetical protein
VTGGLGFIVCEAEDRYAYGVGALVIRLYGTDRVLADGGRDRYERVEKGTGGEESHRGRGGWSERHTVYSSRDSCGSPTRRITCFEYVSQNIG